MFGNNPAVRSSLSINSRTIFSRLFRRHIGQIASRDDAPKDACPSEHFELQDPWSTHSGTFTAFDAPDLGVRNFGPSTRAQSL